MSRAVRFRPAAEDDIRAIYRNGFVEFGREQADRYHDGLDAVFDFLARYPRAARLREEIDPAVRAHPYKAHLIVYELGDGDLVTILRVRHGHEDWMSD
ncbi:hypothetical protein BH10PSE14_BH10PSE14_35550 [soil metagenome]